MNKKQVLSLILSVKYPSEIAELAGIPVPENTKLIIAEISGVGSVLRYLVKNYLQY